MAVAATPAFRFDGENKAAQAAAKRQAARMVTNVSDETKAAIRDLITRSIREGIPPYDAARSIRSMVGMTSRQAQAAMNYRTSLLNSGLTLERVNTLVDRYTEKKIRERADMIARTEIMDALNDGALEAWGQAQDDGLLGDSATKEVLVVDDGACVQNICPPLEGVKIPLDQPFETSAGDFMAPPFHPHCRCTPVVNP